MKGIDPRKLSASDMFIAGQARGRMLTVGLGGWPTLCSPGAPRVPELRCGANVKAGINRWALEARRHSSCLITCVGINSGIPSADTEHRGCECELKGRGGPTESEGALG